MTTKKSTKSALLSSVLATLLCVAMLIGTTFAWFTDSVTSGKNQIVAGNLDVELQYAVLDENGSISEWKSADGATDIFDADALWEPGYTQVVYLKVLNQGTLALKYQFGINVADKVLGKTADDKDIDLSNYIKFGVVDNVASAYETRDAARAAVADSAALISAGYSSAEGHLAAGADSGMIAMVVYMPEEVGNEANHGTEKTAPSIDLGISLVATQDTVERDSFGKDYDEKAGYPVSSSNFTDMLEKGGSLTLTENVTIESKYENNNIIPQVVTMANGSVLDLAGKTISNDNFGLVLQGSNVTVQNGSFVANNGQNGDAYALFVGDEGVTNTFVVQNVTMKGGINVYNASQVILKNCEIHGNTYWTVWADYGAEIIIESGTYYAGGSGVIGASSGDTSTGAPAGSVIVKGGTFNADPSAYLDAGYKAVSEMDDNGVIWYTVVPE